MNQKLLILFLCIICYSCNKTATPNERFFIPKHSVDKRIINKYYITTYPNDQSDIKTTLEYSYLKKVNDSVFSKEIFNPAFKLKSSQQFIIQNQDIVQLNYTRFYPRDTLVAIYQENELTNRYLTFSKDTVDYTIKLENKDSIYIQIRQSASFHKDTLVASKPAKIIERSATNTLFFGKTPRNTSQFKILDIYVQDIGLWKSTTTTDTNVMEKILIEQLPPEAFDTLSKHTIKRVGYIDFDKTIDKDQELELCSDHKFIADYYNGGNDRAGFIGGKGSLKRLVFSKLDTSKLKNESGYITFRFVINCKGKAGKFITNESADFDYNQKQFPEETIMHLYDIISNVKQWKPCVIRNTRRDAYFYITFILKNGKIQDILP